MAKKVLRWKPSAVKAVSKCWFASDQLLSSGSMRVGCTEIADVFHPKTGELVSKNKPTGGWVICHADPRLAALLGAEGVAYDAPNGRRYYTSIQ